MLRELKIENLAIIDEVDLEFERGLIVLTGETGAGKSIILSGINLLIGERVNVDMIRTGEEKLSAQGIFEVNEEQKEEILNNFDIETEDNEVIVRRVYDVNGKGKVFINGIRVSLGVLKEIMGTLVDIVGQHSHQMLLNKSNHIKLLDKFLGDKGKELLKKTQFFYMRYKDTNKKIMEIEETKADAIEKREFYEFQLSELEKVNLKIDEDIALEDEYKKLFNAGKIKEKIETSVNLLRDGEINALHFVNASKKQMETLEKYGDEYVEVLEKLEKIYYELQDCVDIISTLNEDIDIDDNRLQQISERLDLINKMKMKYGGDISDILKFKESIAEKINLLEESNFELKHLSKEREEFEKEYWKNATELRNLRKTKGLEIEKRLKTELKFLKMEDAKIKINLEELESMGINGSDNVEIMISTNIGQELKPLSKIASGGEVSRIMLALKVIFSKVDNLPILIFDEIDTGVGGETVRKIADKLREIGDNTQVMAITHSPAIASKAHEQFYIKKQHIGKTTKTTVTKLDYDGRIEEIARMLAGNNITDAVREHAKELLKGE